MQSHATGKRAERSAQHRARAPSEENQATKPLSLPLPSFLLAPAATPFLSTGSETMFPRRLRSHATGNDAERTAQHRARAPSEGNRPSKPSSSPSPSTLSALAAIPPLPTGGRRPCSAAAYARMQPINAPSAPRNIAQGRRREEIEHRNHPARRRRRPFRPSRNP